jgi:plasmid stabilization system protein ParE
MQQLYITDTAQKDADDIFEYLSVDNIDMAREVLLAIDITVQGILTMNHIGHRGRIMNTREFVMSKYPYIIVYTIADDGIYILTIMHMARKWPSKL